MTYFFHISIGLLVMVCQTTIAQHLVLFNGLYDLLIVQIIYLGLYRPLRESLIIVGLFGLAMDGLTGGSYGLYLTSYFWIYAGVRWALTFFRLSNTLITPFVVVFGVLIENLVHWIGAMSFDAFPGHTMNTGFNHVILQMIWALLTGPLVLLLIKKMYQRSVRWRRQLIMTGNHHS